MRRAVDDGHVRPTEARNSILRERIAIIVAIAAPALVYVGGLGLYTDDWFFLRLLLFAPDQSLRGLYATMSQAHNLAARPPQIALYLFWYKLMPGSVLGPHLCNHAMLLATGLVLHDGLRRCPALERLAMPLVLGWLCAPHFTTERMWLANAMATVAMLCFALAVRAIAPLATGTAKLTPVRAGILAAASLAGALAYILLSFTLLLVPIALWSAAGHGWRAILSDADWRRVSLITLAALGATCLFQLLVVPELLPSRSFLGFAFRTTGLFGRAAITNFGELGLLLPWHAARITLGPHGGMLPVLAALLTTGTTAWALDKRTIAAPLPPRAIAGAGGAAFFLGLAGLVPGGLYENGPFGIGNRTNMGAALGVALLLVAAAQALGRAKPSYGRLLLLAWVACGTLLITALGRNWSAAATEQDRIHTALREAVPLPAQGGRILLQGVCPYVGAVPVFNASWGLADRLSIEAKHAIAADTVRPITEVSAEGVTIGSHDWYETSPYGDLIVFDMATRQSARLASREAATAWFSEHPPRLPVGCSYYGSGGVDPARPSQPDS